MQSKLYLSELKTLDKEIHLKRSRIEELRYRARGIRSPQLYADRVQVSRGAGSMTDLIGKAVEIEKEVQDMTLQYFLLKDKVINLIHTLDDPLYVELLYLKYVGRYDKHTGITKYMTLADIAKTVRRTDGRLYTPEYIRGSHGEALKLLDASMETSPSPLGGLLTEPRQRESGVDNFSARPLT